MPPFFFPENAIVTTTGIFKFINAKSWIQTHGGKYVVWSPRITHILVGANTESWKLQHVSSSVRILHESEIVENLRSDLWVDRYRPKTVHDVIGHTSQMNDLLKWLREFPNPKAERAALLTGPPGIGKTTVAHAVARQTGYDIVEFNASDERSAKAVRELFEKAVKGSCIQTTSSTKRLIIMDEVDGMSAGDRGGVVEIAKICKISPFPIICIANDGKSPKLRPLVSATLEVKFARPTKTTIAKALMTSVVKQENLAVKQADLELMCEQNGNDIRSIVNSLQFDALTTGKSAAKDKDEVHRLDIFTASARIFNPSTAFDERMNMAFFDHGMVPLMVAEGYIGAADKAKVPAGKDRDLDGLERCVKAGEYVGMWDIMDRRIHQTQNWGLLPGAVAAIASAAKTANGTAPYPLFATWLGKNSKRTKHRRMLSELRGHMGSTSADPGLLDTRDTLRTILYTPSLNPTQVVSRLQELKLTRDDMMETLVETCFKGEEKSVEMDTKKKSAVTREWKKFAPKTVTGKKEEADSEEADDVIDPFDEEEIDLTMI